jgi:hypothetical protein
MRILKRLLVFLVVLIVLLIIVAFFLPKNVHVERTVASKASPEAVYGYLNNLKTYDEWMPWNKIDPNMKKTWGDKSEGTGAWYSWTSDNSSVGKGKLTTGHIHGRLEYYSGWRRFKSDLVYGYEYGKQPYGTLGGIVYEPFDRTAI